MHYSYWNKIHWFLTSAIVGIELTFKRRSMRKQPLIPKSQHSRLSLLEKYPTHPSYLERKKKKYRDKAQSEKTCWEQTNVLLKATVHSELYNVV